MKFLKLRGSVGRALFRPLGWKPGEEPGEMGAAEKVAKMSETKGAKTGKKKDEEPAKKTSSASTGEETEPVVDTPGTKKKAKGKGKGKGSKTKKVTEAFNLPEPDLLQGQSVKMIAHKERVLPCAFVQFVYCPDYQLRHRRYT